MQLIQLSNFNFPFKIIFNQLFIFMLFFLLGIQLLSCSLRFRNLQTNFQIDKITINLNYNGQSTFSNRVSSPARFLQNEIIMCLTFTQFNFDSGKAFYITQKVSPNNVTLDYSFKIYSDYYSGIQFKVAIIITNHYGLVYSVPYKIVGTDETNQNIPPSNFPQFTNYPGVSSSQRLPNQTTLINFFWGIRGNMQTNASDPITNNLLYNVLNFTVGGKMNGIVIYGQSLQINRTLDYHGIYKFAYRRISHHSLTKQTTITVSFNFLPSSPSATKSGLWVNSEIAWFTEFSQVNSSNSRIKSQFSSSQSSNSVTYNFQGTLHNYTFHSLVFIQLFCDGGGQIIREDQNGCVSSCSGPQKVFIQDKNLCFCVNGKFQINCDCKNSNTGNNNVGCLECQRQCTICDLKKNWYLNSGQCNCLNGYFRNVNVCQECAVQCSTCNSKSNCITCPNTRNIPPACNCQGIFVQNDPKTKECRPCSQYCQQCLGTFNNCTSCNKNNKNRILKGSTCICDDHYFQQAGSSKCAICFHLCKTCTSKEECQSCQANAKFKNVTNSICQCIKGYYDDGTQCTLCPNQCDGCLSANICIDCNSNANFLKQKESGKCICTSQYFLSRTTSPLACSKCDNTCKQCISGSNNNCTQCFPKFYLIQGRCNCQPTYYLDSNSNPVSCIQCPAKCKTCSGPSGCVSCFTQLRRYLNNNNQCVCQANYYEAGGDQCFKCNYKCGNCSNSPTSCTTCSHSTRSPTPSCNCISTHYENFQVACKPCKNKCLQCTSQYYCTKCTAPKNSSIIISYTIENGQCKCISNQKNKTFDQGSGCQFCHYSCQSCRNAINCISCNSSNHRTFLEGRCKCITGYYDDITKNPPSCQPCNQTTPPFCVTCLNDSFCQSCDFAKNRTLTNDRKCDCFSGYYSHSLSEICTPCHYSCKTCTSDTQNSCSTCDGSNFRQINKNFCICINHYFDEDNTPRCKQCHYSCLTCNNQKKNNCVHCDQTVHRSDPPNNNSQCLCQQKYYDDGESMECFSCHYPCQTCTQINTCDSCTDDTNLTDDKKVHRKFNPFTLYCQCTLGFFDSELDQKKCQPCHYSCKHCTKRVCLSCNQKKQRISVQTIECACKPGYFDDGRNEECQQCDKVCKTCTETKSKCLECKNQKMKFNSSTNTCSCLDGYYTTQNNDCKICNIPFCRKCSKINQCDQCQGNLYLQSQNQCKKICNKNEFFDLENNRCLPYCPLHYYFNQQSRKCIKDISSKLRQHGFIFEVKGKEVYESNSAKLQVNITFTKFPVTFLKDIQNILQVYQKQTKLNYKYTALDNYINLILEPYQTQLNQPIYFVIDKINVIVNNSYFLQNQREELLVVNFVTSKDAQKRNIINIILLIMAIIIFLTVILPIPFTSFQQYFYFGLLIIYKSKGKLPYIIPQFSPSLINFFYNFNQNIELKILMIISLPLLLLLNRFLRKMPYARLILLVEKSKALFNFFYIYSLPILYTFFNSLGSKNSKLQLYTSFVEAFLFSSALAFITLIIQTNHYQSPGLLSPFYQTNTGKQYAHSFSRIWRMLFISVSSVFQPKFALIISLVTHCLYGVFILLRNKCVVCEYISLVMIVVMNLILVLIQQYRLVDNSFLYSGYVIFIMFVLGFVFQLLVNVIIIIKFLRKYLVQQQNEIKSKNRWFQTQARIITLD